MKHPLPVELFLASAAIAAFLIFVVYSIVWIVVYGIQQQIASFAIEVRRDQADARRIAVRTCERRRQTLRHQVF